MNTQNILFMVEAGNNPLRRKKKIKREGEKSYVLLW